MITRLEVVKRVLGRIEGYNQFDPAKLASVIDEIGNLTSGITLGEEGTFLIRFHIPRYSRENLGQRVRVEWPSSRLTQVQRTQIADKIIRRLEHLGDNAPDEHGFDGRSVWAWWD